MYNPLRLAGRARGVEYEKRVTASIHSGSQSLDMSGAAISSCHHESIPGSMSTVSDPTLRTVITAFTDGHPCSASTALALSGICFPP